MFKRTCQNVCGQVRLTRHPPYEKKNLSMGEMKTDVRGEASDRKILVVSFLQHDDITLQGTEVPITHQGIGSSKFK